MTLAWFNSLQRSTSVRRIASFFQRSHAKVSLHLCHPVISYTNDINSGF